LLRWSPGSTKSCSSEDGRIACIAWTRARKLDYPALTTLDGDIAVPPKLKKEEPTVRKRLLEAGFEEEFVGDDPPPATHYHYGRICIAIEADRTDSKPSELRGAKNPHSRAARLQRQGERSALHPRYDRSVFRKPGRITRHLQNAIVPKLHPRRVVELKSAADKLFGKVADTAREARLIATGRRLSAERLAETARAGLKEIFGEEKKG